MTRYRAILTGASGGIGRALAAALAPHCDDLLLVGRDPARLAEAVAECGKPARVLIADLATAAGRDAVAAHALNPNALAPMQLTRRMLPLLERAPQAWIVNVGSIFGYLGYPGHAAYSASKFALRGFTEALRRELAEGRVRVLYFAPRATRTPMNGKALCALNAELGVAMDEPAAVAAELVRALARPGRERLLGLPERLFARINQLLPGLVDCALRRQLPAIRRHSTEGGSR